VLLLLLLLPPPPMLLVCLLLLDVRSAHFLCNAEQLQQLTGSDLHANGCLVTSCALLRQ
jgi:hypothetical protein